MENVSGKGNERENKKKKNVEKQTNVNLKRIKRE